ncbi:hypothetical protein ACF0H5_007065 [Mactra antiquata]
MDIRMYKITLTLYFILTVFITVNKVVGNFEPELELSSCLQGKVTLLLHGGTDGGIIYIQNREPACRRVTRDTLTRVEFDFQECNIKWGETFKVVIQRKSLYQTWDDKQFPVTCYPDISDLKVVQDVKYSELYDEPGISKTTKPRAMMLLLRNNEDIAGDVISLRDNLTMIIQLEAAYENDFDIDVDSCFADVIQTIKDGCSLDTELFPDFVDVRQGKLQTTFRAFRPTNQKGGTIKISFTCNLNIYIGNHIKPSCDRLPDYIRVNNESRKRRDDENDDYNYINVTATVDVTDDDDGDNYYRGVNATATVDVTNDDDDDDDDADDGGGGNDNRYVHVTATTDRTGDDDDNLLQVSTRRLEEYSCTCAGSETFITVTVLLSASVVGCLVIIVLLKRKIKHTQSKCRRLTKDEVHHLMRMADRNS